MAKQDRITIQCARCRRVGEKLFLKGEKCFSVHCPLIKRNYRPGQHGLDKRARLTGYGEQLKEKQKAKQVYGLRERQFSNYVAQATKIKGNTAAALIQVLERRLDNVVYRLGLAKSREAARQLVSHAHFLIDNKKVNIPSYSVKINQTISVREKSKAKKIFENLSVSLIKQELPGWLSLDVANFSGKVLAMPKSEDIQVNFDLKKIIEFYSR